MTPFFMTFLKTAEGLQLSAYDDQGHRAIGYGHQINEETESHLLVGEITRAQAEGLLVMDAQAALDGLDRLIESRVILMPHERESLGSLTFNIGVNALSSSTILTLVRERDYRSASREFRRWCHAGGQPSEYLLKRRVAEELWFLGGSQDSALNILTGVWR